MLRTVARLAAGAARRRHREGLLLLRAAREPAFPALRARLDALLPTSSAALMAPTVLFPAGLALGAVLVARGRRAPRPD